MLAGIVGHHLWLTGLEDSRRQQTSAPEVFVSSWEALSNGSLLQQSQSGVETEIGNSGEGVLPASAAPTYKVNNISRGTGAALQ